MKNGIRAKPSRLLRSSKYAFDSAALVVYEPAGVVFRGWRGPRPVGKRWAVTRNVFTPNLAARVAISGVFSPVVGEVAVSALPDAVRMRRTECREQ
jgi:hypothetical protein